MKEISRREFLYMISGFIGSSLVGCSEDRHIQKSEIRKLGDDALISPNSSAKFAFAEISNNLPDFSISIYPQALVFANTNLGLPIPLKSPPDVYISNYSRYLTDASGNTVFYQVIDPPHAKGSIVIYAGGLFDLVMSLTGKPPQDERDQLFLSMSISESFFSGLGMLAYKSGKISAEKQKDLTKSYVRHLQYSNDRKLIANLHIPNVLPFPSEITPAVQAMDPFNLYKTL
jgi:hypothetical protein